METVPMPTTQRLIDVTLHVPGQEETLWARLPQVPSRDEVVSFALIEYRVGGVEWRLDRGPEDPVGLMVAHVFLAEIG